MSVLMDHIIKIAKAKKIQMGPPPVPNRKEYPFVGTIKYQGLEVHIENAPGSYRTWPGGSTLMHHYYGEIKKSRGTDGDKLDAYVGTNPNAKEVYIVHQNFPKSGRYDEDKVMLGFDSPEEAKDAYLKHYDSPKFFGSMTIMSMKEFKKKIFGVAKGSVVV